MRFPWSRQRDIYTPFYSKFHLKTPNNYNKSPKFSSIKNWSVITELLQRQNGHESLYPVEKIQSNFKRAKLDFEREPHPPMKTVWSLLIGELRVIRKWAIRVRSKIKQLLYTGTQEIKLKYPYILGINNKVMLYFFYIIKRVYIFHWNWKRPRCPSD